MVKIFQERFPAGIQGIKNPGYYMDGYLKANLDMTRKEIKKDWDMVFSVDGVEGAGKSVLAMQIAYYCDPTLTLDRVVFTPEDFTKAILNADKFQAVVYDEGYSGLSSRSAMSELNKSLVRMLAEIRQKNLFVFVVAPTFFDLDKYVALWRSRALIHVYAPQFQRGYFRFYNYNKKKDLYVQGKKFYSYRKPEPNFIGRYTGFYPLDQEEYKDKKKKSLKDYGERETKKKTIQTIKHEIYKEICHNMLYVQRRVKVNKRDTAALLGVHEDSVRKYTQIDPDHDRGTNIINNLSNSPRGGEIEE